MFVRPVFLIVALAASPAAAAPAAAAAAPAAAAAAPAPAAAAPAAAAPETSCGDAREAAKRYAAGQYSEAAVMYEACARSSGDATYWKKAGMARYSARQYAHAIQALGGYPRATAGAEEDAPIVAMLRDAQAQCAVVRFGVTAETEAPRPERLRLVPRAGDPGRDAIEIPWSRSTVALDVWLDPGAWIAELTLPDGAQVGPQDVTVMPAKQAQQVLFRVATPAVEAAPPASDPLAPYFRVWLTVGPKGAVRRWFDVTWTGPGEVGAVTTHVRRTMWTLPHGTWTLQVGGRRFVPQTRQIELGADLEVAVTLKRTREEKARIGLSVATGGVGAGLLIGGLVGAVGGGKDYRDALSGFEADRDAALSGALVGIQRTSTGTIASGAGIGAGLAAASIAGDAGDRLLGAEVGVGAALLITGLAWLIPAKRRYHRDAADLLEQDEDWRIDRTYLDEHRRPELAAATLLGLGAGLSGGAAAALITRALLRSGKSRGNASVGPLTAPRVVGLNFRAAF